MLEWILGDQVAIARIVFIAVCAYALLILVLRITGKRTLTKLNAFDLVITVAIGSMFSTIILDDSISLAEGFVSLFMLVLLQYLVTWSSIRIRFIGKLIKSQPTLLYYQGAYLEKNMRHERVTHDEIRQAARVSGNASMDTVKAVVLEPDGSLSVLTDTGALIDTMETGT